MNIKPEVGMPLELKSGRCEKLLPCDDWENANFRFPGVLGDYAINIKVTGRKIQYRHGGQWIRVKIIWVGDCEPDKHSFGWLKI